MGSIVSSRRREAGGGGERFPFVGDFHPSELEFPQRAQPHQSPFSTPRLSTLPKLTKSAGSLPWSPVLNPKTREDRALLVNREYACMGTFGGRSMFVRVPGKLSWEAMGTFGGRSDSTAWSYRPARCSFGFSFRPDGCVKGVHGTERGGVTNRLFCCVFPETMSEEKRTNYLPLPPFYTQLQALVPFYHNTPSLLPFPYICPFPSLHPKWCVTPTPLKGFQSRAVCSRRNPLVGRTGEPCPNAILS
jgi:hypothetical protein